MTDADESLDAPCDNGFAVDLARLLAADKRSKAAAEESAAAAAARRAAIAVMKNAHNMDNKRIGNLLGLTPGAIQRALTPRRSRVKLQRNQSDHR